MNQKTIVEALQKALTHGEGSLDDLDTLLKRAQEDIVTAKKEIEEAAAKAKAEQQKKETARAAKCAEIATRLLNRKLTAADMTFIYNTWGAQNGLGDEVLTEEEFQRTWDDSVAMTENTDELTSKIADEIINIVKSLFTFKGEDQKPVEKKERDNADLVLQEFLKKNKL